MNNTEFLNNLNQSPDKIETELDSMLNDVCHRLDISDRNLLIDGLDINLLTEESENDDDFTLARISRNLWSAHLYISDRHGS